VEEGRPIVQKEIQVFYQMLFPLVVVLIQVAEVTLLQMVLVLVVMDKQLHILLEQVLLVKVITVVQVTVLEMVEVVAAVLVL
jgi:hypothetical protein